MDRMGFFVSHFLGIINSAQTSECLLLFIRQPQRSPAQILCLGPAIEVRQIRPCVKLQHITTKAPGRQAEKEIRETEGERKKKATFSPY
ncbi:hypothetical protein NPIL_197331 [Nephila pilipes]|uniref:Uncharacterized protein n=1 Tax=Nephila pilipes TaxID=299642 RepID=A0A8X6PJG3_NEPPI|nr:hypothetical protein NPIL_197331 [Nephila pilipes]